MFKNLFGKKDKEEQPSSTLKKGDVVVSFGDNIVYKKMRQLSPELQKQINYSPLLIMQTQLFMHYWNPELKEQNEKDQMWSNQAIYFWSAEEKFEKKSLPPFFEGFEKRYFVIAKDSPDISFMSMTVIPWFGMPGMGQKNFGKRGETEVTIQELLKEGIIEYVEIVELQENNAGILSQREDYYFLVDNRIVRFINNNFLVGDKRVPLSIAYEIGGVHIVKTKQNDNKEDPSRFMPK